MVTPLAVVVKGYPRLSETFIAQELKALEDRGFEFQIWSLRRPYDDREHPIHAEISAPRRYLPEYLHQEPLRVLSSLAAAARLAGFLTALGTWLRDLRRDPSLNRIRRFGQAAVLARELPRKTRFVYAHFLHTPSSVARYAALMRGISWGFSAHAKDIWTIPEWEKREKIADARFGVTCTNSGAHHLESLDRLGNKITLAYHGLDLGRFPPPTDIRPKNNALSLMSVGRLVEKKGYDDLLEALSLLPRGLDWRFRHIGGGKLEKKLRDLSEEYGLADRIEWLGKQDQTAVIEAMRTSDLFVLPSKVAGDGDRDGLPNVLMEAASQKLPILATATTAIPEFIEDGVHGILVPPGEPQKLAMAIRKLADAPEQRAELANAAYRRLVEQFGISTGIDILDERLRRALEPA